MISETLFPSESLEFSEKYMMKSSVRQMYKLSGSTRKEDREMERRTDKHTDGQRDRQTYRRTTVGIERLACIILYHIVFPDTLQSDG